jgi:hypothetical protein
MKKEASDYINQHKNSAFNVHMYEQEVQMPEEIVNE